MWKDKQAVFFPSLELILILQCPTHVPAWASHATLLCLGHWSLATHFLPEITCGIPQSEKCLQCPIH